ncbi:hypothetical protein GLOTRDRAFT_130507 [Gloeophyllum trabeum ATCC 11539]|uniref:Uncharacterized protein n=1 Tax=Gloeophyllum trabeum (strain ATCC 11539 / FP-39264 / Madison 617) TaxID=670483 RepID=S7Q3I8_GLOTA|nr:uncharacterized protein GLOTRDRAFT_130507 [Gloeophyllum trabeum ATCC 11539]EPQ54122.1 hypothetical protein GLOTRDRAFT_130507 [Gloeophyllum trabeum ATCC 11539]
MPDVMLTTHKDGSTSQDGSAREAWRLNDTKAIGTIHLRCSPAIAALIQNKTTAKETWEELDDTYGITSLASIYNKLCGALTTKIPADQHPAPAFAKIAKHFNVLASEKMIIPNCLQGLVCLNALPLWYDSLIQVLVQKLTSTMDIDNVREAVVTAWEQAQNKKTTQLGAHKISAVKHKLGDPSFALQQQQHPQGSSSNARDGKKCPYYGKRTGKKHQGHNHDHHHAHDVLITLTVSLPPTTIAHVLNITPTGSRTRTVKEQGPFHPPPSADSHHYNNKWIKKAFKLTQ